MTLATISTATADAARGDALHVAGDAFADDMTFWLYGQTTLNNGGLFQATVLRINGNCATIVVPTGLPTGMYVIYPKTVAGYGNPIGLNRTEAWWLSSDSTGDNYELRNGIMSMHGNNLLGARVWLQPLNSTGQWAVVTETNQYRVDFTVPAGLLGPGTSTSANPYTTGSKTFTTATSLGYPAGMEVVIKAKNVAFSDSGTLTGTVTSDVGTSLVVNVTSAVRTLGEGDGTNWLIFPLYQVFAHNQHGGKYGWSLCPQRLGVGDNNSLYLNYDAYTYTMPSPTGADDSAFNSAISTLVANSYIGTISLAAGNYVLSSAKLLTRRINVEGAGKSLTTVTTAGGFSDGVLFDGSNGGCQLKNLSINATGAIFTQGSACLVQRSMNSGFLTPENQSHRFVGMACYVRDCDLASKGLFGNSMPSSSIKGCVVQSGWNVDRPFQLWRTSNSWVRDCEYSDYDYPTTHGQGGMVNYSYDCSNVCVDNINGHNLYARPDGGEQFLCDGTEVVYCAFAISGGTSGGYSTVTIPYAGGLSVGQHLFVIGGTGVTQSGIITAISSNTVTLDALFKVAVDSTSLVMVGSGNSRCVLRNSSMEGRADQLSPGVNRTPMGFSFYQPTSNCHVNGITVSNLAHGFAANVNEQGLLYITDLVIGPLNTVSSGSVNFDTKVGGILHILTNTSGWTAGNYVITSSTAGVATLASSPGTNGSTSGVGYFAIWMPQYGVKISNVTIDNCQVGPITVARPYQGYPITTGTSGPLFTVVIKNVTATDISDHITNVMGTLATDFIVYDSCSLKDALYGFDTFIGDGGHVAGTVLLYNATVTRGDATFSGSRGISPNEFGYVTVVTRGTGEVSGFEANNVGTNQN